MKQPDAPKPLDVQSKMSMKSSRKAKHCLQCPGFPIHKNPSGHIVPEIHPKDNSKWAVCNDDCYYCKIPY